MHSASMSHWTRLHGYDYADRFLFNLNLLQENVGAADVFPADAALADYLRSIYHTVGWELLPPRRT